MACPSEWNTFYFLGGYTGGLPGGIDAVGWLTNRTASIYYMA
jgi:hypothetical protein